MEKPAKKILIIVTNTSESGDFHKTGVWLEEFAVPFLLFKEAGFEVAVASPLGGVSPIDEASLKCENPTEWDYTKKELDNTQKLDEINYTEFDAVFLPGGHGPVFDLAKDVKTAQIISYFYDAHKPVAAVCHGPAGLLGAVTKGGEPIVKGMRLTSFTNEEEKFGIKERFEFEDVKAETILPFMLETELKRLGAIFKEGAPYQEHVVHDENLITGQNPQSSKLLAETVIKKLEN